VGTSGGPRSTEIYRFKNRDKATLELPNYSIKDNPFIYAQGLQTSETKSYDSIRYPLTKVIPFYLVARNIIRDIVYRIHSNVKTGRKITEGATGEDADPRGPRSAEIYRFKNREKASPELPYFQ
jgi:hypothetical protein